MLQYMLESTVVQRESGKAAEIVFVPKDALQLLTVAPVDAIDSFGVLGLAPGVPIPTAEGIEDVFFASLNRRVVPFDAGSFDRWRSQREAAAGSTAAVMAHQLVVRQRFSW